MGAILLDGESVAERLNAEVADRVAHLATEGIHVGLGTVLVGDDPSSERYVGMKHADCAALGIYSAGEHLPATATQAEVLDVIDRFNATRRSAPSWSSSRCPRGSTRRRPCSPSTPPRTSTGCTP